MNYPRINKGLMIIKGIKLFYIFTLQKLFEFNFQNWFDEIPEVFEVSTNVMRFELLWTWFK
jgi:flagellin-specific chaperone FliS